MDINLFIHKYKNLELFSRKVVEGFLTSLHKSPFHGFSVEFAEHRQYNRGESIRHIDWKLFSKTDKLFVKKYEDETNLRCHFVIDQSASMFVPKSSYSKYQFSLIASACMMQVLRKQRDAFGLTFFEETIVESTSVKSTSSHFIELINLLQSKLELNQKNRATNTGNALSLLAEKIHRRSLVVIFTDLTENLDQKDDFLKGLQHLHFRKHDILLVNVTHGKLEQELSYENIPTNFIDAETGESIKLNPQEVRKEYQAKLQEYQSDLLAKCMQYKIETFTAHIESDLEKTLEAFMRVRNK
jgi:uncharacterized protein (DUF58 family)